MRTIAADLEKLVAKFRKSGIPENEIKPLVLAYLTGLSDGVAKLQGRLHRDCAIHPDDRATASQLQAEIKALYELSAQMAGLRKRS